MNKILRKVELAPEINLYEIEAPLIAQKALPGQFIVIRVHEEGERIPMTVVEAKAGSGNVVIIAQEVGKSTRHFGLLGEGDRILDVIGPLGKPTEIEKFGTVVCVGGGIGIAPIYPITKAMKAKGNTVVSIIGARSKNLLILEEKMRKVSDELYVTTDDGTYGHKGFVTDELKRLIAAGKAIDRVLAIGPVIMMKAVSELTRPFNIKTIVSLNPIMVDGTGMCGGCRVEVGGETKFSCVDGPEFDGHRVNFDLLMARQRIYLHEEKTSLELFEQSLRRRKRAQSKS